MHDVICVGTTTIDLYFAGGDLMMTDGSMGLENGKKYFAGSFHESVGGGATNVAIGLQKNDLHATLVSEIGQNPFKRVIFEKLDISGVSRSHLVMSDEYQNFSMILLSRMGEKTVVNYRTPYTQFLRYLPPDDLFQKSKSLYLGHMAHIALEHRVRLLQKARRYALVTYATLGEDELRKGASYIGDLIHHIDFLIINKTEFAAYVGCAEDEIQLNTDIYSTFPQLPLSKTLIITNGAQGAHAYSLHEQWYEPAHPAKHIVDLTGAGDGFCAGFIASYQRHRHISAALKAASQYAASKLSHLGAN